MVLLGQILLGLVIVFPFPGPGLGNQLGPIVLYTTILAFHDFPRLTFGAYSLLILFLLTDSGLDSIIFFLLDG
jgi:hypothetical protein